MNILMESPFARTASLLGEEAIQLLQRKTVAVFGLGGVGGSCAEALARSGIGRLILVDHDIIQPSNLNRQVVALHSTLGQPKAQVMAARVRDINPAIQADPYLIFYHQETADSIPLETCDAVVDCVDSLEAKLLLARQAQEMGFILLSAMGAGNRQDPMGFKFADIYETSVCPLARRMRKACREQGIPSLRVLYSTEPPLSTKTDQGMLHPSIGSLPYVPPAAGMALAGETVRLLLLKP
ncbi:MAG: tRNA threonylcarbamoyladenosine dehydratase [Christensenellales bacterium]|jgi:tRNA A37 threonylcarbamoyladenosine dehydratase